MVHNLRIFADKDTVPVATPSAMPSTATPTGANSNHDAPSIRDVIDHGNAHFPDVFKVLDNQRLQMEATDPAQHHGHLHKLAVGYIEVRGMRRKVHALLSSTDLKIHYFDGSDKLNEKDKRDITWLTPFSYCNVLPPYTKTKIYALLVLYYFAQKIRVDSRLMKITSGIYGWSQPYFTVFFEKITNRQDVQCLCACRAFSRDEASSTF